MKIRHALVLGGTLVVAMAAAAPAAAQFYPGNSRSTVWERRAYDNGYREGLNRGERDFRDRRPFNYQDEEGYRKADKGYEKRETDRGSYRRVFRSGYVDGYSVGYRTNDNRGGNYGRAVPRGNPYPGGGYPGRGYPGRGYPGDVYQDRYPNSGYGYGYSPAFRNGQADGYEKGIEDANKNRSYDPLRHKWYREGDHNYSGGYGSRDAYKNTYRQGFREGYDQGYREARRWR